MPRAYVQQVRADAADAKRRHILDVTVAMLATTPLPKITLDAVAKQAGVARSTVYVAFGSRTGLFEATAAHLLERMGFDRVVESIRAPDVLDALRDSLREGTRMYAAERDGARALWSWGELDPDAAKAIAVLEHGRWEGMLDLARRLDRQGVLREDVTTAEAADLLWILTSFDTFDQLSRGRRLGADAVTERLQLFAERALMQD